MQLAPYGRFIAPGIVAVLGMLASFVAWRTLALAEDHAIRSHFEAEAVQRTATVQHALSDALLVVEAVGALFRHSREEIPDAFPGVALDLVEREPGLRALGWNPRIAVSQREAFENESGTVITEWGADGVSLARTRPFYHPVRAIVPVEGNAAALGFDVTSEPRRRIALERAEATGAVSITSSITLVQGERPTLGFLAFHPEYAKEIPASGDPAVRGFVVGVFDVAGIFEGLGPSGGHHEVFTLYDLGGEHPEKVHAVGVSDPHLATSAYSGRVWGGFREPPENFVVSKAFEVGGRQWSVKVSPSISGIDGHRTPVPDRVLVLGLLATAVSVLLVVSLTGRNQAVQRLVEQRTEELEHARGWLEERVAMRTADLASSNRDLAREIAQRESAESALRASEERLRLTLDTVSDGGWDWNFKEQRVVLSDSWYRSVGREPGSILVYEDLSKELIHPDDVSAWQAALRKHLKGETPHYQCRMRMKTASGEWRWFEDRAAVVAWDEDGKPLRMVGVHTDVTEQRRLEEERRLFAEEVQQTQRLESLGVLAGGIAHDFNNLLAGVLGNADLASLKLGASSPCHAELEEVKLAARRAAELTRQLLAYAGKARFSMESIDLSQLVAEMTRLLAASISKGAALDCDLPDDLPAIEGDRGQIQQVVMNLITNASDALGDAPGRIAVRTGTCSDPASAVEGCLVYVEVVDDGCGMDETTRQRMFDPFFTTKFQGRGLGLAAALGIVRTHGGAIEIDSEKGQGTRFRVKFPCAAGCAPLPTPESPQTMAAAAGTILVVDDEPSVLSFAERSLAHVGFATLGAASGPEAVEVFQANADAVDAVLLDLTMPAMTGREVMLALRKIRPTVRILASSGYTEEEGLEGFGSERPDGFLQKPYLARDLVEALTKLLA